MEKYSTNSSVKAAPQPTGPSSVPSSPINEHTNIRSTDFTDRHPGFVFGTGTSAYQHEGGAAKGGRGKSIWDDFTLRTPGRIDDGTNGNGGADMYTRYQEDIEMMRSIGFGAYRFSISWARILPGGRPCLGVNQEGVDFYNDIINTLLAKGIEPYVTLFHFDLPHCLELEYGGFACQENEEDGNKIVNDFVAFAEVCFWKFGDRVEKWTTLNEPWSYAVHGYVDKHFPPSKRYTGRSTTLSVADSASSKLANGGFIRYRDVPRFYDDDKTSIPSDPDSEGKNQGEVVYTVAKNLLLCHAYTYDLYKNNFKNNQGGEIGMSHICHWFEPYNKKDKDDYDASKRAIDFMLGWFLEPVLSGEYPETMKPYADPFSDDEKKLLKGSIDFLGLNYYTANYAQNRSDPVIGGTGYYEDMKVTFYTEDPDGKPIGKVAGSSWLYIVPWGIHHLLKHTSINYKHLPPIYITENGVDEKNNLEKSAYEACDDTERINYHADHLYYIKLAMDTDPTENLDVKGYFLWSWCDNFEWTEGFNVRFGLIYIDFLNELVRYPKKSASWFANHFFNAKAKLNLRRHIPSNIS